VRLVYLGTPADSVPPLRGLVEAGHEIALVITQPDRRRARGPERLPSPVKSAALDLGLPVVTAERASEVVGDVRQSEAALGVVVAFGQILPESLLEVLPHGFVNLHFSLLPRWRGAAPVERAILAGDSETGVCVVRVERDLDAGPVYACERLPMGAESTAGEVRHDLVAKGTRLLLDTIPRVADMVPEPQRGEPTYAAKLSVREFRVDASRPAVDLSRLVRAGSPRPGAWFEVGGRRVKVLRAGPVGYGPVPGEVVQSGGEAVLGTAAGGLVLAEVQPQGRRPMSGAAWLSGRRGRTVLDESGPGAGG